ncbi:hypothetical protein [Streptomyces viridochromogenes]|uniref:Uncharacterized protein n=1 Tax=Streptomyces viridochromogenes Tue57 TaxID=1160705 RepID=L8PEQ2_STRVR|nr:hypothetical protein [Streptomyces viridochromogenes]ELS54885.1 hypothetical protein STVIR_4066 [Streptomyces viridochromogenes Tue57]
MAGEAEHWWQALLANDEDTVCEAVNTAFSDNPAAGCAVGVDGSVLSVVVRQQDLDSMPGQTPGLTPGGRPTLKNLTNPVRVTAGSLRQAVTTAAPLSSTSRSAGRSPAGDRSRGAASCSGATSGHGQDG